MRYPAQTDLWRQLWGDRLREVRVLLLFDVLNVQNGKEASEVIEETRSAEFLPRLMRLSGRIVFIYTTKYAQKAVERPVWEPVLKFSNVLCQ